MNRHNRKPLYSVIALFLGAIIIAFPTSSAISQPVEDYRLPTGQYSLPPGLLPWDAGGLSRIMPDASVISVVGNGTPITSGDTEPSTSDDTDFGEVAVSEGTVSHTFTIYNTGDSDLNLTGTYETVSVTGTDADDFTVTDPPESPIAATIGSTTFTVQFDPSAAGLRSATIEIPNDAGGDNIFTFAIQGTGTVTTAPEMDVEGDGSPIENGDSSPSLVDGTDFGGIAVAGDTTTSTFYIYNNGDGDLTLTGSPYVTITGNNAAEFTVTLQPVSPVTPDGSTTFTIEFDPSGAGLRTAELSIANNDSDENPYNFSLQGSGLVYPEMDVLGNSTSITSGDNLPSTTDGTDFGSTPAAGGTVSHTFFIDNSGDGDLNLTGTPKVAVSGTNAGEFTVTTQPSSPVAPDGSTTFIVQFDPSAGGLRVAVLSITSDDSDENPYYFAIQGTGTVAPEMEVRGNTVIIPDGDTEPSDTDWTDFGSTPVLGGMATHSFTIHNLGDDVLTLTGTPLVVVSGTHASDFQVTLQPSSTVAVGGTTIFTVMFDPSVVGLCSAEISIANSDSDENPYNYSIQGTGISAPEIEVRGNSLIIADGDPEPSLTDWTDFGSTAVAGGTISHTFTINNLGDDVLALSGTPLVAVGGTYASEFQVTVQPSSTVAAGGTTTFTVVFDPGGAGLRGATLSIANTDADENPYNFSIQGTGTVATEMEVQGNSLVIPDGDTEPSLTDWTDFGSTAVAGGTISHTFTINNLGDDVLTLTGTPLVAVGGTHASDFQVTLQPSGTVAAGGSTTFTVTFNPNAAGLRSATLSIANNDADENPYNFSIQGTGTVAPEIEVRGNSLIILDGDTEPSLTDWTDFSSTAVALGTISRTFTINNLGDDVLALTGTPLVAVGGTHASEFQVTVQPSSTVGVGGSTTFTVVFDPGGAGLRSATLSIANNDADENPYNFSIQGSGTVAAEMEVQGNSLVITDGDLEPSLTDWTDFGSTAVAGGTISHTFTINNLGDDVLTLTGTPLVAVGGTHASEFQVTVQPSSTVGVGGSTTFTVTFNPSGAGLRSATLSIANNDSDENPYNFSIQGTGTVAPEMEVQGNSLIILDGDTEPSLTDWTDFGSVVVTGGTVAHTFTINNLGDGVLTLSGTPLVAVSGTHASEFQVTVQPSSTVAVGGTTTFTVVFDPSAVGLRSAEISIANTDSDENPYNFYIQGTGYYPPEMGVLGNGISIPDNDTAPTTADGTDFGSAAILNAIVLHTFTINNTGAGDLTLSGTPKVAISGTNAADFSVSVQPSSPVVPGSSTTFTVVFNPSAAGLRTATLSISNNDLDENPYNFNIQGTGVNAAEIEVRGNTLLILDGDSAPSIPDGTDFGSTPVAGGTVTHSFMIKNIGDATLNLTGSPRVAVLGANVSDFTVSVQPASTVAPGESTTFTVVFNPNAGGLRVTELSILNNDSNESPYNFSIQGTGVNPPGAFTRLTPAYGATEVSTSPSLSWSASSEAETYEYCYDTTPDNACATWIDNGSNTSAGLSGLSSVTMYYWHVRAVNIAGTTYADGSATLFWNFTTTFAVSPDFYKTSPVNNATNRPLSLNLSWGTSVGADSYEYCYDTSDDDACTTWVSVGTATSAALSGLREETTYYWHVRAYHNAVIVYSDGASTAFWSFTTGDYFETLYLPIIRK